MRAQRASALLSSSIACALPRAQPCFQSTCHPPPLGPCLPPPGPATAGGCRGAGACGTQLPTAPWCSAVCAFRPRLRAEGEDGWASGGGKAGKQAGKCSNGTCPQCVCVCARMCVHLCVHACDRPAVTGTCDAKNRPPTPETKPPKPLLHLLWWPVCRAPSPIHPPLPQLVALLNERSTEPIIKGWLLALLLSLVHPATGLNPETLKVCRAGGGAQLLWHVGRRVAGGPLCVCACSCPNFLSGKHRPALLCGWYAQLRSGCNQCV